MNIVTNSHNGNTYRFTDEEVTAYFDKIRNAGYEVEDVCNGDEYGVTYYFAKDAKSVQVTVNDEGSFLEFCNPNPIFTEAA